MLSRWAGENNMGFCCEMNVIGPMEMVTLDGHGVERARESCGYLLAVPEEAEDAVNDIALSCQHTGDYWGAIERIVNSWREIPWALIALDREYKLAGHLMSTKGDTRELRFAWYSVNRRVPTHLSWLFVMNKSILAKLADRSPLFGHPWALLHDKPEDRRWFCIIDPLPEVWVNETESVDAELFESLEKKGMVPKPII